MGLIRYESGSGVSLVAKKSEVNLALEKVRAAEAQCAEFEQRLAATAIPSRASLLSLAQDLPAVWQASSDMRLKQRIVRLVLREIVADVDPASRAVTLVLHWAGDRHSQVRWTKNSAGWQGRSTLTVQAIIRKMARAFPDQEIALTLNRQQPESMPATDVPCIQATLLARVHVPLSFPGISRIVEPAKSGWCRTTGPSIKATVISGRPWPSFIKSERRTMSSGLIANP